MNILALDCGTKTGWATSVDGKIESGMQDFTKRRGESNGVMFLRFNAWLREMCGMIGAGDIAVYERAHHRGGAATEIGVGLATRVMEYATEVGSEYMAVHSASIKKHVTGNGRASKKDIMDWFTTTTGKQPIDDNESDAMALLYYTLNEMKEPLPTNDKP